MCFCLFSSHWCETQTEAPPRGPRAMIHLQPQPAGVVAQEQAEQVRGGLRTRTGTFPGVSSGTFITNWLCFQDNYIWLEKQCWAEKYI